MLILRQMTKLSRLPMTMWIWTMMNMRPRRARTRKHTRRMSKAKLTLERRRTHKGTNTLGRRHKTIDPMLNHMTRTT